MESNNGPASSRRVEAYRRAAAKKRRNTFGLIAGFVFIFIGVFINEIIVFGGALVVGLSVLNLYASVYAEKQLRIIVQMADAPPAPAPARPSPQVDTKECPHCKKQIPSSDKFCGECGKKLA
jgi:hypothetical protein